MRMLQRWRAATCAAILCLLMACGSCVERAADVAPPEEPLQAAQPVSAADFAGHSPAELEQTIEKATAEADRLADFLATGVNYELRLREFHRQVATAAAAADALARHDRASAAQRQQAALGKLKLYYTAAQTDRATFEPRLASEVTRWQAEDPQSQAAVVGEAMLLELTCLSGDAPHEEKLQALVDFANRHGASPAGAALFIEYGDQLEQQDRADAAMECYRAALKLFPDSPQLRPVRERLAALEADRRRRQAANEAHREKVAAIRRKLVAQDGYFVIYTFEKKKMLYRFEYDVLHGPDAAVSHILNVPKNWDWKLTARFPETPDGLTRAQKLAEEKIKKETYMKTFVPG